jgi:hypothetical protein
MDAQANPAYRKGVIGLKSVQRQLESGLTPMTLTRWRQDSRAIELQ